MHSGDRRGHTRPASPMRIERSLVATHPARAPAGAPDDLLLRVTPPRVPRHQVARPRLQSDHEQVRDFPVILVQASAGFGKTSLLAQWRREHLARGSVVAWLSAQPQDNVPRFVQSLALAVRAGAGRPTFGHTLIESAAAGREGVTAWLAEVAQTALDIVLIVDEADRLPAATHEALAYLLRNAPSNLRAVVATRADHRIDIDDLVAYGSCTVVGPTQLRFRLDETIELVRARFGTRVDRDAAARLHELAEGWPLGLQLALSVMAAGSDPQAELSSIAARGGALRDQFVHLLLANLEPPDVAFLTRIAILDPLHPDLCARVLSDAGAPERLARLARDTPVFIAGEASDWLRMHSLARDELQRRFAQLPADEQAALQARAAEALAALGLLEAAALHALAAGQRETAYNLAERSLYESLLTRGHQGAVLEWLARLPADEVDRRPRLLLAAAWSLAVSERHAEANHYIERILAQPGIDAALRCECALIQSGAAVYADDPDRFAALHDPWAKDPPLKDPLLLQVHANRSAFRTLLDGEPALARLRQQQAPRGDQGPTTGLPRPLGRLHRRPGLPVGRSGAAGGQAAAADAGARRGRPRPAWPVRLHAGGAAGHGPVGAQRARRSCRVARQPPRRARAQRPARGRAARFSHDGAHRGRRGCRAPRARVARCARRRRRGAPVAAPAHREPGRPGASACAALSSRDLPRPL